MTVSLGVVMDPIGTINVKKDTTLALLLAAARRGWSLHYMEPGDLCADPDGARASTRPLEVRDDPRDWFSLGERADRPLGGLDAILMRRDPPFDMEYIYCTYLLEQAQRDGALVVNDPAALRDCNEKVFAARFPQCCPPFLVAADPGRLKAFHTRHRDVVYKPLDGMGGAGVFRVREGDTNLGVIIETLTGNGRIPIMAQRFIPEIADGDKRILLIDGEPAPGALARLPPPGELRGNLAAGGTGVGRKLTERDLWICGQVGPALREKGLLFAGIDVIGEHLTEINVTSPTGVRETDRAFGMDIGAGVMDAIQARLEKRGRRTRAWPRSRPDRKPDKAATPDKAAAGHAARRSGSMGRPKRRQERGMPYNPVNWFEIYVQDMDRAKDFYETVLGVLLAPLPGGPEGELAMMAFPADPKYSGAAGALVHMPDMPSGGNSTIVYFRCEDCAREGGRVSSAGGAIERDKFSIGEYGFIILARDPDGNMFGLHSLK